MNMKEIVEYLEEKNYTYLIHNKEQTWVSEGINPIKARIEDK